MIKSGRSIPAGLAIGLAACLAATLAATLIISVLVDSQVIRPESAGNGVCAGMLAASVAGSLAAICTVKKQPLLMAAGVAALYMAAMCAVTAMFFGGQYQGMGVTALLIFGGSIGAALLQLRTKQTGKRRRIRYRK